MGKLLFAGGMFGTLAFIVWSITQMGNSEPQRSFPIGFGEPKGQTVEMNIVVGIMLPREDPPRLEHNVVQWDKWVAEHFQVTSATGEAVALRRSDFTKVIPQTLAGTPEFYLIGQLKPGTAYTFDFTPVSGQPERWRHEFTAPTGPTEAEHVVLTQVANE